MLVSTVALITVVKFISVVDAEATKVDAAIHHFDEALEGFETLSLFEPLGVASRSLRQFNDLKLTNLPPRTEEYSGADQPRPRRCRLWGLSRTPGWRCCALRRPQV